MFLQKLNLFLIREKINFKINNQVHEAIIKYIAIDSTNAKNVSEYTTMTKIKRTLLIYPSALNLEIAFQLLFDPLKSVATGFEKNVSFLEITPVGTADISTYASFEIFRIGCDWCSLCNGIIETARQNLILSPQLILNIDIIKIKLFNKFLNGALSGYKNKITLNNIHSWLKNNNFAQYLLRNPHLYNSFVVIAELYLKLEQIELRACPFKRSKEFYYRNYDARYLNPLAINIYLVGKILAINDTIDCYNCASVVNDQWNKKYYYTPSPNKSIFELYLKYLINYYNN
jgi:hypothetical protein